MIVFGPFHQNVDGRVPREVAEWLTDRNTRYPETTFQLNRRETPDAERAEMDPIVQKYSRSFINGNMPGVSLVVFYYYAEVWTIRIIGYLDEKQRNEIAQLPDPSELERGNAKTLLQKRRSDQPALERPTDLLTLRPDEETVSSFSTTGEAINQANKTFHVSKYNDPRQTIETPLMTALGEATDPFEANAIAYKLYVAGQLTRDNALPGETAGGHLSFGVRVAYGEHSICIDMLDEFPDRTTVFVRCLSRNESLSKEEYPFWESIAQHDLTKKCIFAVESEMHPLDEAFIKRMASAFPKVHLTFIKPQTE